MDAKIAGLSRTVATLEKSAKTLFERLDKAEAQIVKVLQVLNRISGDAVSTMSPDDVAKVKAAVYNDMNESADKFVPTIKIVRILTRVLGIKRVKHAEVKRVLDWLRAHLLTLHNQAKASYKALFAAETPKINISGKRAYFHRILPPFVSCY